MPTDPDRPPVLLVVFTTYGMQVLFIVTFLAMAVVRLAGTDGVNPVAPLRGDGTTATGVGAVFAGAAVLCLSLLGFDAVSTLSEEATRPARDVPRAIMIATVGSGLLFIALAYVSQLVFPSDAFSDADSGALDVMRTAGGNFLDVFFTAVFVPGALGAALTAQASVARVLYAMGRDGVLPGSFFGRLSPRFRTPAHAVLLVGYDTMASIVSFGALVAFSAANLSVAKPAEGRIVLAGNGNALVGHPRPRLPAAYPEDGGRGRVSR